jgi:hypothetical protein
MDLNSKAASGNEPIDADGQGCGKISGLLACQARRIGSGG